MTKRNQQIIIDKIRNQKIIIDKIRIQKIIIDNSNSNESSNLFFRLSSVRKFGFFLKDKICFLPQKEEAENERGNINKQGKK